MKKTKAIEHSGQRRKGILITVTIFATFLIYGFYENMKGPALPRIQADFGISEFQLGLLLAVNSLGYLIACSYTTALAKKISIKVCLIISLIVIAISGIFICFSPSYILLVISFLILHLGNGMLEISQGVIAATTFTKNTGTMMNIAHFFYGAGSIFSPVISTGLMMARFGESILGWRYVYLIVLSWAIIPIIPALIWRPGKQGSSNVKAKFTAILKKPTLWLTVLILAFGSVCEVGVMAWLVNFLEKAYSYTGEQAALRLTLFFVCFTLTRLIFGPLIDRIGLINSLVIATAFAGVMTVLGVLIGEPGVVLLIIAGVGVAPLYPTVMAVIAKLFSEEIDHAMTAIMTIMGVFFVAANLLVGGIIQLARSIFVDIHGDEGVGMAYAAGYLFLGVCCFVATLFAIILRSRQKKAGNLV